MAATQSLDLFTCGPYGVRLSPRACGQRFKMSKKAGPTSQDMQRVRECKGCEVGKAHAKGRDGAVDLSPTTVTVSEWGGKKLEKAGFQNKVCPCGEIFTPLHGNTVYCKPDCEAHPSPRKQRKPRKKRPGAGPVEKSCKRCATRFTVEGQARSRIYCDQCKY